MDDNAAELCCESLKIIFNLLLSSEKPSDLSPDDDDDVELQRDLIKIVRQLLSVKSNALKKQEELKRLGENHPTDQTMALISVIFPRKCCLVMPSIC